MDYEKEYKDALNRAESELGIAKMGSDSLAEKVIGNIFPQLKDDERIVTEIINVISNNQSQYVRPYKDVWINWLEKQREEIKLKKTSR